MFFITTTTPDSKQAKECILSDKEGLKPKTPTSSCVISKVPSAQGKTKMIAISAAIMFEYMSLSTTNKTIKAEKHIINIKLF